MAFVSAACLAAPAMTPTIHESPLAIATIPVELSAAVTSFDPVPPSARTLGGSVAPIEDAKLVEAVDTMAELSGVDTGTLLLQLLTAPYHNVYAVSIALGKAVNAVVQLVSLPFSVATYVLTNRTAELPAYLQTVRNNLGNAIPGVVDSVQSEIGYDLDLLAQLFGGNQDTATVKSAADTVTAQADPGTLFLQLLTIPYHNIYGVSIAVGKAVNAVVQLAGLPFSVATYVLTNRTAEIPAYVNTVRTNLQGALPGISNSIKSEIAYDKNIVSQIFGGTSGATALQSRQAPNLLAGDATAAGVFDSGVHPLLAEATRDHSAVEQQPEASPTEDVAGSDTTDAPKSEGPKHRAPEDEDQSDSTTDAPADAESDKSDTKSDSKADDKAGTKAETSATEKPSSDTATSGASAETSGASTGGKHRKPEADAA
ncbi:MSCRAMM family adhesin SdrC [Mycolicibacterium psychrotolerans]|uniref:MSCRAMM family adhesin SdrC n=1 Tax=Mycolicibacterium psychrotolerans TaxID=216929 RepID=UPI0021F3335A|nr:MSCRAMM family adhesin SdrC [Mycolicibacterium psychrotolerans]